MAHVNYSRQLQTRFSDSLDRVIPLDLGGFNFAAFGGTPDQRADAAVRTVSRYCGRCGIVVLINDSDQNQAGYLEAQLRRMPADLPDTHAVFRSTPVSTIPWSQYDMLYGLDEDAISALMFPGQNLESHTMQTNSTLVGLQSYLAIMRSQFQENSTAFGAYPFNLNLLYQLTAMPYEQLNARVLRYLPDDVYYRVQPALSRDSVQSNVHALVHRFSEKFRRFGCLPRDFGCHSRRSIVQAVSRREVVCIRIPGSSETLMSYVESELQQLSDMGIAHMVISSGLNLTRCPALQARFLSQPSANVYMGILSESMSGIASSEEQQTQIFDNYPQILVFHCGSTTLAEPFSVNCGTYKRREVKHHAVKHWAPFHIFPTVGGGDDEAWVDERNIRADELTELNNGVLLCGKLYAMPVKINNLRRNGGRTDGVHMPQLPPGHQ